MIQLQQASDTIACGYCLGTLLPKGTTVTLEGDLGTGKTTFSKGIAEGLGITQLIKSPTYTLIREYDEGRCPLYHMDVYRLEDSGGADLGLEEYFDSDGICVVEWGHFIQDILPDDYIEVCLTRMDDATRTLQLHAHGNTQALVDTLQQALKNAEA